MLNPISSGPYPAHSKRSERLTSLDRFPAPVVSVIIPTYNRAGSILRAVDSVAAQTFADFELIIVDDGSSDRTLDLLAGVRDPRVDFIAHTSNRGAAAARNSGIRSARGRYIAFLDADDWWAPEKLERQLAYMAAQKGKIRLCCTAFHYRDTESGLHETRMLEQFITQQVLLRGCRCSPGSTLMAERSLFQDVGLFNGSVRRLEDWDWLLRCSLHFPLGILQQPLATVQARLSSNGHYIHVAQSAAHVRRSLDAVVRSLGGRKARRTASAGLANELAAAAYLDGKPLIAAMHSFVGFAFAPAHQFSVAVRAAQRTWHDIARAVNAWRNQNDTT